MPALPLPPDITRVIRTMCRERPWLGARKGAFRNCYHASRDLARRLRRAGRPAAVALVSVPRLGDCHPRWKFFRSREHCIAHYAVLCDEFIIDLTARQFDTRAPFPRITRRTQEDTHGPIQRRGRVP
jgi:hypothetical protein